MSRFFLLLFFVLGISNTLKAQQPQKLSSSEIHDQIKKLNFLGTALYIAAHPDDENTRLISYLSNNLHARTAYLSLTRGDGGQNLIGPELRALLGVLRTQELLAARNVDGGEQFFTRANDFGYSKHPDETLAIWNKNEVLSDVVWAIRKFRPDVIINRFDHRSPGTTHGHHTSSAMLSMEAFDIAGKTDVYKEQLAYYKPWQPKRIFFNTSWWFYGSREKFEKADKSKMLNVDAGVYYPSKGVSNTEIAALSRSQHKCQGFGSTGTRGEQKEYLEFLKGDFPKNNDLFDGIDTSWNRINGGKAIGDILYAVEKNFNFNNPSAHVADLMKAYQLIQNIKDDYWKAQKTTEILAIIEACSGLYLEATAKEASSNLSADNTINIEAIARGNNAISLININYIGKDFNQQKALLPNKRLNTSIDINVSNENGLSSPYWLSSEGTLGMYNVPNKLLIGLPETPNNNFVRFDLKIENTPISIIKNIVYKYTDPAKGEIYEPFQILPEVTSSIQEDVYIFNDDSTKEVNVTVRAGKDNIKGVVTLNIPKGWSVNPKNFNFDLAKKGATKTFHFKVTPSAKQSEGKISSSVLLNGRQYHKELIEIAYDHIPKQSVLVNSEAKVVKLDIKKKGQLIGYIKGSGDVTVESLEHIGYTVNELTVASINELADITQYDAIVIGIRAYNVLDQIPFKQPILFDYVKNGGNLVVQYNTRHRLKTDQLAPYNIKLSRDRVTDEFAEVKFLAPNHEVLNYPNKITQKDFEGWVQERGLYFPNSWDKAFTPILSMHDKGEKNKKGSLLVAKYGKGYYVYTGLSFFREFPAGVPGAYRLFTNLISLGKNSHEN